jgi:dTDP-4-dehydrorhamnose reductase
MTSPIIIYGKNGQLGSALASLLGDNAIVIASTDVDFSVYENVATKLCGMSPKAIINATAYTNVDLAETDQQAAYKANVEIPAALAKYAREIDVPFIHYSTDYVFSGEGSKPHKEEDAPSPVNIYGKTKLEGERAVAEIGGKYLILRTSWVYDATHKNFLTTMLRLGKEREELSIVCDQIGAPTYAHDLAEVTLKILDDQDAGASNFPSGIYHLCNSGETNWYEYAKAIFAIAQNKNIPLKVKSVTPIFSEQYKTPAKRPLNSRLDCGKAKSILKVEMPDWKASLEKCMEKIFESNTNTTERPVSYRT